MARVAEKEAAFGYVELIGEIRTRFLVEEVDAHHVRLEANLHERVRCLRIANHRGIESSVLVTSSRLLLVELLDRTPQLRVPALAVTNGHCRQGL